MGMSTARDVATTVTRPASGPYERRMCVGGVVPCGVCVHVCACTRE